MIHKLGALNAQLIGATCSMFDSEGVGEGWKIVF